MTDKKVFDDYTPVDCNNCQQYWYDLCDGVPDDTERPCTSYVATRNSDIPKQIDELRRQLKISDRTSLVFYILFMLHLFLDLFGGNF